MTYTKEKIICELQNELSNIENLYKAKCINRTGKTSKGVFFSEIIANELLRNLKEFDKITTVTRKSTYCRENHQKIEIDLTSNRNEEIFAKRITKLSFDELGTVMDYQIPLKDTREDNGLGKIDLVSYDAKSKTLFLIELKYMGNKETLLRAILESYTYYKIVDKEKLIDDCINNQQFILNKLQNSVSLKEIKVVPTVLLVPNCQASDDLTDVETGERPKLQALALALDIKFFTLNIDVSGASFQNILPF